MKFPAARRPVRVMAFRKDRRDLKDKKDAAINGVDLGHALGIGDARRACARAGRLL
jgi:hypothetical protein